MAMTREDAALYAAAEFTELLDDAGLSPAEDGGLKNPIDQAFRYLGIPLTEPVPDGKELSFLRVLDWTVLSRIERALARRVDVTVEGPSQSKRYSQAVAHVAALKAEAWKHAEPIVVAGDEVADEWDVGTVSLGIVAYPPKGYIS